jgi:hypothetical protein
VDGIRVVAQPLQVGAPQLDAVCRCGQGQAVKGSDGSRSPAHGLGSPVSTGSSVNSIP